MTRTTPSPTMPMNTVVTTSLQDDCRRAIHSLRGSLIELFASVRADPSVPQDVARRFGLNKNLTWKVSKIVAAADGISAIPHIPGTAGLDILLTTFASQGAPAPLIAAVRASAESFQRVVEQHAGDRAHLDLMLDSMGLLDGTPRLEASRELAFRGNSGIWGVQARARVTVGFVAPNRADPSQVVTALVGGLVGFRRLRPEVSWPLFRFISYRDDGSIDARRPLDFTPLFGGTNRPNDPALLLREFCSAQLPEIRSRAFGPHHVDLLLPKGPVGNTASFDAFFGHIAGPAARYRDDANECGEFSSTVSLPVETLLFDVIVHRDLVMNPPDVIVYGRHTLSPDDPAARDEEDILPLSQHCEELIGQPPVVATPVFARHSELVRRVCERLEFPLSEFRGYRLQLPHPPMGSTVVLRWPLESR